MSSYTMRLGEYIESFSQYETGLTLSDKIEIGRPKLFDFEYPIFDPEYKKVFETHFIKEFYMREIGFETEGLFKLRLETQLNIDMPYFNKLFESELIQYDPLENSNVDVTHNKTNDTNQTGSSTSDSSATRTDNNFNRDVFSDTPDSRLSLTTNDGEGILEYASKISEDSENNTSDASSSSNDTVNSDVNSVEDFIQHRAGKIGIQTYAKMIQEHRTTFLRIEREIFRELNQLFMLVY